MDRSTVDSRWRLSRCCCISRVFAMEGLLVAAEVTLAFFLLGGKLGLIGAFALPAAIAVARFAGERFFRIYATVTTAGIGLALASLMVRLVKVAATG
jgi:hypothetical protein